MSIGFLAPTPAAQMSGLSTQPSSQSAALIYQRRLLESERHRTLINLYSYYEGTHYSYVRDIAEPLVTSNYCAAFVNKSAVFLAGHGFTFQTESGEDNTEEIEVINKVWDESERNFLFYQLAVIAGISGDAFVKITYVPETDQIVLVPLDTQTCFPVFNSYNPDVFDKFKVEYIVSTGDTGDYNDVHLYTEIYTKDEIRIGWDGADSKTYQNPFGFVPIVQFKNILNPRSFYGQSDLHDIIPLNRLLNEQITTFQDIVNYHAAPVTVMYGVKSSNMVKGARKVWSGLPKDARVENLELNTDLAALQNLIGNIKTQMHEISGIPVNSLGQEQAISNTSNAALQTQYLPLIDKTTAKQLIYGKSLKRVNKMILQINNVVRGTTLNEKLQMNIQWESPLPKDIERLIGQQIVPLKTVGLISDTEALKQLGYKQPAIMLAQIRKERLENAEIEGRMQEIAPGTPPTNADGTQPARKALQLPDSTKPEEPDSAKENQELPGGESS